MTQNYEVTNEWTIFKGGLKCKGKVAELVKVYVDFLDSMSKLYKYNKNIVNISTVWNTINRLYLELKQISPIGDYIGLEIHIHYCSEELGAALEPFNEMYNKYGNAF